MVYSDFCIYSRCSEKEYMDFVYNLYKDDENFSDMNLILVKNFFRRKDNFAKKCIIHPFKISINLNKSIYMVGLFIMPQDSKYIYLSFLEFKSLDAEKTIRTLRAVCYEYLCVPEHKGKTIVLGINGHISYGLGILVDKYNTNFEFNSNYNKPYYTKELDKLFTVKKNAFSYVYDANNTKSFLDTKMLNNIYNNFEFRFMNKLNFKHEMMLFGDLCDKCLSNTPYYYHKSPFEMYQLMKQMKFLLKNEDLIFIMKDKKEVGFILTHPDYAQLFDKPKINYLKLLFNLLTKRADTIIYNIIGVLPEYQKEGLAVGLIDYSINIRKNKFKNCVSSFILEDNEASNKLCSKISTRINKQYRLYEFVPNENDAELLKRTGYGARQRYWRIRGTVFYV